MATIKKGRSARFQLSKHDLKRLAIALLVLVGGWFVVNISDVQTLLVSYGIGEETAIVALNFLAYFANKFISDFTKDG